MNHNEAITKAQNYLREFAQAHPDIGHPVIQQKFTREHEKVWVFVFNSTEYLENGDAAYMLFPNALVVPRDGSDMYYAPTDVRLDSFLAEL